MVKTTSNKNIKITLVILICIKVAFFLINTAYNLYFLIANINQPIINSIINISIIIIIALLLNHKVNKVAKYLLNLFVIIFIFAIIAAYALFDSDKHYFYFEAPNKSNTLIVEENSFLLGGYSKFYERKALIFIKDLKSQINTDDGYKPFSDNHYQLKWIDDTTIELQYDFGAGGSEYNKTTIKIN